MKELNVELFLLWLFVLLLVFLVGLGIGKQESDIDAVKELPVNANHKIELNDSTYLMVKIQTQIIRR